MNFLAEARRAEMRAFHPSLIRLDSFCSFAEGAIGFDVVVEAAVARRGTRLAS